MVADARRLRCRLFRAIDAEMTVASRVVYGRRGCLQAKRPWFSKKHNQTRRIALFRGCDEMGSRAGIFFISGRRSGSDNNRVPGLRLGYATSARRFPDSRIPPRGETGWRDVINPEHAPDFVCKYRIRLADISRWPSGDPRYRCVARFFASGRPKSP